MNANKTKINNKLKIICNNETLITNIYEKYSPILCNLSIINITFINEHKVIIDAQFDININEELPIYMENFPGMMMKKIFNNLKLFIENIE